MIKLRPYQEKAVEFVLSKAVERANARVLIVLPAGGGKTPIAAALLNLTVQLQEGMRGLFVAHRAELLDQARRTFADFGIPESSLSKLGEENDRTKIVFAGVDMLRARGADNYPNADVIVTDEAHRDAGTFRRELRAAYGDVLRVGFTATPERLDGKSLREDFDEMYVAAQPSELIADGHLVAPRIFTVPSDQMPNLDGIRIKEGDFDRGEVERRSNVPAILGNIVDHWTRRADGRPTLVFACSKAHSHAIVRSFKDKGIKARHVDGETDPEERKWILEALKERRIDVVSSCDLLSEGIDIPAVKCVVMARPTHSLVMFNQQAGRCMRPFTNDVRSALILDHAGNTIRHGYPHADREWSIDAVKVNDRNIGDRNLNKKAMACARCFAVLLPHSRECFECGHKIERIQPLPTWDRNRIIPTELPGELVDIAVAIPLDRRLSEYQKIVEFANQKGFAIDWANKVYSAKYGEREPKRVDN